MKNITVHCLTQEVADKVVQKAIRNGYNYQYGPVEGQNNYWPTFKEATCYSVERGYLVVSSIDSRDPEKDFVQGQDYLKYEYP